MGIFDFFKRGSNDNQDNITKTYHENGKLKSEVNLKDGKVEGLGKSYHENGKLQSEGNYKDGKREGLFKTYFENGKLLREGYLKDDKEEGLWKLYHENGQLESEGNMKDSKHEGLWKSYHENGLLSAEVNFKDGILEGLAKIYHENGQLKQEVNYKDNKQEGFGKSYYENGLLSTEVNFKDGILEGYYIEYNDKTGKLEFEGNYKNGENEGKWKKYDENGEFKGFIYYEDGVIVKEETNSKSKNEINSIPETEIIKLIKVFRMKKFSNKRVWNRNLHITPPNELSLLVPVELQKSKFWNYFLDNKPFNGIVYYIENEDEIFESPDFYDFLSTSEEEKQKLDGYEFDIKDGVKNGKQREYIKQILRKEYEMKNDKWNGIHKEFDVNGQIKHKLNFKNGVRID